MKPSFFREKSVCGEGNLVVKVFHSSAKFLAGLTVGMLRSTGSLVGQEENKNELFQKKMTVERICKKWVEESSDYIFTPKGGASTYPFEIWFYRYLEGVGSGVEIEFFDPTGNGESRIADSTDEKDAVLFAPPLS